VCPRDGLAARGLIFPLLKSRTMGPTPVANPRTQMPAFHESGMRLASKMDRGTSGKSRTQADLSRTWIKGCFPAVRSNRELLIMCDYSLHFVASRPARVGDKLVSTRFRTSP